MGTILRRTWLNGVVAMLDPEVPHTFFRLPVLVLVGSHHNRQMLHAQLRWSQAVRAMDN